MPLTRAFGDPGLTQGVALMGVLQERRAEQRPTAAPPPSSLPASQVVAVCSPHARISEEQRARWPPFPGAPKPSLGDRASAASPGVCQPGGSQHSPQLCSTHSTFSPIFLVCTEGRGGADLSVRPGWAAYDLWDLPHTGHSPLNLFPSSLK